MPPSSEQVVLVGDPFVDQANAAVVDVLEAGGVEVSITVGAVTPPPALSVPPLLPVVPPPVLAPSTTEPKSCVQYQSPFAPCAAPIPIAR